MQTPKTKTGSLEVPQRKSPRTPRTARQLKTLSSDSDSVSTSPLAATRTPNERSPRVVERKSPRSPAAVSKRPSRVAESESELSQLQEELKKANDQLSSSESYKRQAQQEAEETKKQLLDMSAKLEESQQQLLELSASEEDRVQELHKISQDRDRAWQSELEAVREQHSMDAAALTSAMNEVQRLKVQLEMVSESEATESKLAESAQVEIQYLRTQLSETLSLVEKLKAELHDCRESEARTLEVARENQNLLETANAKVEKLELDGIKIVEAYESLSLELEQSKAHIQSLEGHVSKIKKEMEDTTCNDLDLYPTVNSIAVKENEGSDEINQLKAELTSMRLEADQSKSALDAAETKFHEEYVRSTLQIRIAHELVERSKVESCQKEAELEAEFKEAKATIEQLRIDLKEKETQLDNFVEKNRELSVEIGKYVSVERESELAMELKRVEADMAELKNRLLDKETELQGTTVENEFLKAEIKKMEMGRNTINDEVVALELKRLEADMAELKTNLLDKETELQGTTEENEVLKVEIKKMEVERNRINDDAVALAETTKAAEQKALMKLGHATEEADKSSRKTARVSEQLDAAQAANSEMEAELRRLKVQADQWRKAAEAAAAILSTGNNGKLVDRTVSLDSSYPLGSPYSEDLDDESPKKRNGNMLKKIGVLWRKSQK